MSVLDNQKAAPRARGGARSGGGRTPVNLPRIRKTVTLVAGLLLLAVLVFGVVRLAEWVFTDTSLSGEQGRVVIRRSEGRAIMIEVAERRVLIRALNASAPGAFANEWMMDLTDGDLKRLVDAFGGILVHIPDVVEYRSDEGIPLLIEPGMRRLDGGRIAVFLGVPETGKAGPVRAVALGVSARISELIGEGYNIVELLEASLPAREKPSASRLGALLVAASAAGPADVVVEWPDEAAARPPKREDPSPMPPPARLRLRILNGVGISGLAADAATKFPTDSFMIVETANAESTEVAKTTIRSVNLEWAREVAQNLGVGEPIQAGAVGDVDVVVILGRDFRGR